MKPKYLRCDRDAKGAERWYYRRPGSPQIRLPGGPRHPDFDRAYAAARNGIRLFSKGQEEPVRVEKRPAPKAPRHTRLRAGYVYFLRIGATIKIGYSADPFNRVTDLRTAIAGKVDSFLAVPGTRHDERHFHDQLASYRIEREWFRAHPAVTRAMARAAVYGVGEAFDVPPSDPHCPKTTVAQCNQ